MEKSHFYSNLSKLSELLTNYGTDLSNFMFGSKVYVEGIRESVSEVEKYCKRGMRILDLGCGTGLLSMQLSSLGFDVVGLDVEHDNPEKIEEFKKKKGLQFKIWKTLESNTLKFYFYDGLKLPFRSQSFDTVVAHAVIEHIPRKNLTYLLREIKRILKSGGTFFIFRTPRKQAYAEHLTRFLKMGGHDILMNENQLLLNLQKCGFKIICFKRTDMILGGLPGILQDVWNFFSPALLVIDKFLLKTPISNFAHHIQIVCQKV